MKNILVSALFLGLIVSGCAGATGHAVSASIYNGSKNGSAVTSNAKGSKMGKSCATGVLGFGFGDATIETAMMDGNITTVSHVDADSFSLLGVYATKCTVVYGN